MKFIFILLSITCLGLVSCTRIVNYPEPDGPVFWGDYRQHQTSSEKKIKVVTWNIRYSNNLEKAIWELENAVELQDTDLLLLQEVDEESVEEIAKTLGMMYVYYPASIHNHHGRNFGNAVLSKYYIKEHQKIILPFSNPKNGQIRIAVKTRVEVGGNDFLIYSVHTETNWLGNVKRNAQYDALINSIGDDTGIVVGGDFNTMTDLSVTYLQERFAKNDLTHATRGNFPTIEFLGLRFKMDHIFVNNIKVIDRGVWVGTEASDHFPLWVILEISQL